jgi:hypothetical protein
MLLMPHSSYQTPPLQKNNGIEDRGGNHELFEHLMDSWVGYELVKVLLKYGLSPKFHCDLNKWSPQLYKLFSYFDKKQWDSSKRPTQLLDVLFKKTNHCSYFEKLPFGKNTKFKKNEQCHNTVGYIDMATPTSGTLIPTI